jgi:hypothetical protein
VGRSVGPGRGEQNRLENQRNKRKRRGTSSPFKGVRRDKQSGKYHARCTYGGEHQHVGSFDADAEVEAARAYDRAAAAWLGEYVPLNFPREWPPERRARVYVDAQAEREALDAKIAATKRRKAKKAKAKKRKAKGKERKGNQTPPARAKAPTRPECKSLPPDARQATKKPHAKTRRRRKTSEAA